MKIIKIIKIKIIHDLCPLTEVPSAQLLVVHNLLDEVRYPRLPPTGISCHVLSGSVRIGEVSLWHSLLADEIRVKDQRTLESKHSGPASCLIDTAREAMPRFFSAGL